MQRASISSLEAGIPTANEFLTLTDLDSEVDSDDDLQKGEIYNTYTAWKLRFQVLILAAQFY